MNIKKTILFLSILLSSTIVNAQKYMTRNGVATFYSKTSLEDIKATNNQVYAILDAASKNLAFTLLMKGFLFDKELMQEHFNEKYVESDKYPKASFTGNYVGDVNTAKDGIYNVTVKGQLTMHGITKAIEAPATLQIQNGHLVGKCTFPVALADYNISIPSLVKDKIAKQLDVTVIADCVAKS